MEINLGRSKNKKISQTLTLCLDTLWYRNLSWILYVYQLPDFKKLGHFDWLSKAKTKAKATQTYIFPCCQRFVNCKLYLDLST